MIVHSKLEPLFQWLQHFVMCFVAFTVPGMAMFLLWLWRKWGEDSRSPLQILWYIFLCNLILSVLGGTASWLEEKEKFKWRIKK